jgi:hypothetical protein
MSDDEAGYRPHRGLHEGGRCSSPASHARRRLYSVYAWFFLAHQHAVFTNNRTDGPPGRVRTSILHCTSLRARYIETTRRRIRIASKETAQPVELPKIAFKTYLLFPSASRFPGEPCRRGEHSSAAHYEHDCRTEGLAQDVFRLLEHRGSCCCYVLRPGNCVWGGMQ